MLMNDYLTCAYICRSTGKIHCSSKHIRGDSPIAFWVLEYMN